MERKKMSNAMRAKQFMPFAALKGYEDALRRKEEEFEKSQMQDKKQNTIPKKAAKTNGTVENETIPSIA